MERPFPAYKGHEPYIFVSYAHEDTEQVFPEIKWLKDQGFNIWYDEGISPGTEWRDELANAIRSADLFLYLVTPHAVESSNCRKEVSYALDADQPILAVHLKPTELPEGLKLSLSDRQAILKHELTDQEYREKVLSGVTSHVKQGQSIGPVAALPVASKSAKPILIGAGLIAIAILAGSLLMMPSEDISDSTSAPVPDEQPKMDQKPYLLVVPFDVSAANGEAWNPFADQVTREIIRNLRKVSGLRVIPVPSALAFRTDKTRPHIRSRLPGVRYVLDGLIMESQGNIRITLALEDLQNDGRIVWDDEHFIRADNSDLFSVQSEIAHSVTASLQVAILDSEELALDNVPTNDFEAYAMYAEGLEYQTKGTNEGFIKSIERFDSAIQRDPNFVQAYVAKANSFRQRMTYFEPPIEMLSHVRVAATAAIALDPESVEARSALGMAYLQSWHLNDAWRYLSDAKSRDPRIGLTHLGLALYYTALGDRQRTFEALAEADRQDPLNPEIAGWGLWAFIMFEDYDHGLKWAKKKVRLFPNVPDVAINAGLFYSASGDHEKAITFAEEGVRMTQRSPFYLIVLAQVYARAGRIDDAREVLAEAEQSETYVCPYETAVAYLLLGNVDGAFQLLDRAVAFRSNCLVFTRQDPRLEPIRQDPRFSQLLEIVGLDDTSIDQYPR